ncbi:hypothetical protein [Microbacterium sp. AR7-10]|nr:hypothetical protein [Microbacterium sp. AR7-10]
MTGSQDGARHAALSASSRRRLLDVLTTDGPMAVSYTHLKKKKY